MFHQRLVKVLEEILTINISGRSVNIAGEIIYVNDGSTDETYPILFRIRESDERVALVDLSRNFGKEVAVTAGLDHAHGDGVVVIDADLQDPPELIPELVKQWLLGYDVVYAKRTARGGESFIKRATAFMFYRIIQIISQINIPEDTGDFRLLSRRAVVAVSQLRERRRFMKGLFVWIGYPQKAVPYRRNIRYAGNTKWNYWRLWNFALEGITSFTTAPLKVATYLGLGGAVGALGYAAFIVYKTIVYGDPVAGYPSLMVTVLFLGSLQLVTIGIIGEYVGRMFDETKQRPLYFLKGFEPPRVQKNMQTSKDQYVVP